MWYMQVLIVLIIHQADIFSQNTTNKDSFHKDQIIIKFKELASKSKSGKLKQDLKAQLRVVRSKSLDFIKAEVWELPTNNADEIMKKISTKSTH